MQLRAGSFLLNKFTLAHHQQEIGWTLVQLEHAVGYLRRS